MTNEEIKALVEDMRLAYCRMTGADPADPAVCRVVAEARVRSVLFPPDISSAAVSDGPPSRQAAGATP